MEKRGEEMQNTNNELLVNIAALALRGCLEIALKRGIL